MTTTERGQPNTSRVETRREPQAEAFSARKRRRHRARRRKRNKVQRVSDYGKRDMKQDSSSASTNSRTRGGGFVRNKAAARAAKLKQNSRWESMATSEEHLNVAYYTNKFSDFSEWTTRQSPDTLVGIGLLDLSALACGITADGQGQDVNNSDNVFQTGKYFYHNEESDTYDFGRNVSLSGNELRAVIFQVIKNLEGEQGTVEEEAQILKQINRQVKRYVATRRGANQVPEVSPEANVGPTFVKRDDAAAEEKLKSFLKEHLSATEDDLEEEKAKLKTDTKGPLLGKLDEKAGKRLKQGLLNMIKIHQKRAHRIRNEDNEGDTLTVYAITDSQIEDENAVADTGASNTFLPDNPRTRRKLKFIRAESQ